VVESRPLVGSSNIRMAGLMSSSCQDNSRHSQQRTERPMRPPARCCHDVATTAAYLQSGLLLQA
jgi:hypothetical protein